MTIDDLNEMTREDLIVIDHALIMLARIERRDTNNTEQTDKATRALNRIAVRYSLVPEDEYMGEVAQS